MTLRELREIINSLPNDCQDSDIEFTVNRVDNLGLPYASKLAFKGVEAFTDLSIEMEFDIGELTD